MPAILVFGKMGANKTHFATSYGLFLANKFQKKIVANYLFHPDNLLKYCQNMRFQWLVENLSKPEPLVYYCNLEEGGMDYILGLDDCVVIFDEVALYVPARGSGALTTKSSKFHKDLTQIRHRHNYLICIAQNHQQIDSAIKNLSEETFHCAGISFYDEELKAPKLFYKIVNRFIPDNYEVWVANPKLRRNPIKTKLLSNKSFSGILTTADMDLFTVYPSFGLVHETNISTMFPDSYGVYYKEPRPFKKDSSGKVLKDKLGNKIRDECFTWAYILPMPKFQIKPKLFTILYTKLPYQYFLVGNKLLKIYRRHNKSGILYQESNDKFTNWIVRGILCIGILEFILFLVTYGFWFILVLLLAPFFFHRLRLRRIVR